MSNFDAAFFKDLLKEERQECLEIPGIDLDLNEAFVEACHTFQNAKKARDEARSKEEADAAITLMQEYLEGCKETAKPILEAIDLTDFDLEMSLVRSAILFRGGAKGFAKFAGESDLHGQLIETLLNNKKIMKEFLLHGGPTKKKYGNAMKLYTQIMAGLQKDRLYKLNKKLAMAVALEFASPQTVFDTSDEIDPLKRFAHYAKAHKKGELDPAFTYFSTWEYRMAVNSDASDEQLTWGRKMQMNYAPHITTLYDERWRYSYQVSTDVGYRAPHWPSSPRTYQQLLSGGGREGPRAWFGRFMCRAFGIPVWGFKQKPKNIGLTRWTPKGWMMNFQLPASDFETIYWKDRPGDDFLEETRARTAVSENEYYEKVILLECLADACKEKIMTDEDIGYVDPDRMFRSLALIQRKILADQVQVDSFERTGPSVVISKIDKYIQNIDDHAPPLPFETDSDSNILIPAASFEESNGKKNVRSHDSFEGENQIHLMNGEGYVTYKIPENVKFLDLRYYTLSAKVSTVQVKQQKLQLDTNNGSSIHEIEIPYTLGEW
eukprot:CAMPEP_0201121948 /NCGR_PEP_ID=MMETSP0850-20130426/5699_1 /ASSEMBLY_ACC=CAM_ASM_000622 /TAXON_ID=183588 /ORGANISM="Pseudo-nitzschia fraudulenta, Strain WWA7" /LENGTH=548 /DNA_ID=CAMNT_0047388515 /DNA_START=78 /DNA_END=1721 /DNA_ORIENTATION=-